MITTALVIIVIFIQTPPVTPEGFVIRLAQGFPADQFSHSIAKYVRKGHVQTDDSWYGTSTQPILIFVI